MLARAGRGGRGRPPGRTRRVGGVELEEEVEAVAAGKNDKRAQRKDADQRHAPHQAGLQIPHMRHWQAQDPNVDANVDDARDDEGQTHVNTATR